MLCAARAACFILPNVVLVLTDVVASVPARGAHARRLVEGTVQPTVTSFCSMNEVLSVFAL